MQNYKIDVLNYSLNGSVRSDCSDITFFNAGTTNLILNNSVTLAAGQSLTINANAGEIDRTIYTYNFSGAGTQKLIVFRKVYI